VIFFLANSEHILFVGIFLWCHTRSQHNAALTSTLLNQTAKQHEKPLWKSYQCRTSTDRFPDEHQCI